MEPLAPELVARLACAAAYPDDPSAARGVEHIQTHLSHVFLTAERVYKLHKAVQFGFVDFGTRALRNADSLREVALNRRLAPDVYLGVSAIVGEGAAIRLAAPAEVLARTGHGGVTAEHCVVMRRLATGRDALSMLERGALGGRQIDALATRIAAFHGANGLGAPAPFAAEAWLARLAAPVRDSFAEIAREPTHEARAQAAAARAADVLRRHAQRFEQRRASGRVVDGHGDLHLAHLFFERDDAEPLAIDCVEFRDDYRQIDAAADVAFLAMDLEYRGRRDLAARFLRRYAEASDDFDLFGVLDFFIAYRAAVRAKVACLAARDPGVPASQRQAEEKSAARHLALAEGALVEPHRGAVVALAGSVGSGKSTVAQALADITGGVVIASDRVRKRLARLPADARGHAELYTDARHEETYAAMRARAAPVVLSGRLAILDATHARASQRRELIDWARAHALRVYVLEARCDEALTRSRLELRARAGTDPSDAGPELLEASQAGFEAIDEIPAAMRATIHTDRPDWLEALANAARCFSLGAAEVRIAIEP